MSSIMKEPLIVSSIILKDDKKLQLLNVEQYNRRTANCEQYTLSRRGSHNCSIMSIII
jgi:hypothetical protein